MFGRKLSGAWELLTRVLKSIISLLTVNAKIKLRLIITVCHIPKHSSVVNGNMHAIFSRTKLFSLGAEHEIALNCGL